MAGYRFCRSDDIPLLVAAHNACWVPHFGPDSALTVEGFKHGIRTLGFWSSSCMVAFDGDEPIGVLIGAKRDRDANCVHRVAVKPGWERKGHGRHLLTSLADKARILGPPRLVAEIPVQWAALRSFFEKSGFVEEARYGDFELDAVGRNTAAAADPRAQLIIPTTLDELVESGAWEAGGRRAWARTAASLRAVASELEGLAVATDRVEAYVLARPAAAGNGHEVVALGAADPAQGPALLALLLRRMLAPDAPATAHMLSEPEASLLAAGGFTLRRVAETIGYAANQPR